MITSEEVREVLKEDKCENVFEALLSIMKETVTDWGIDDEDDRYPMEHDVFDEDDERFKMIWLFITTVHRYFELKAKGITTKDEALEHRELLRQINEMVGIR
jgi:hypothetical protein